MNHNRHSVGYYKGLLIFSFWGFIITIIVSVIATTCGKAQTFEVAALVMKGTMAIKCDGQIIINDSTLTLSMYGQKQVKKIIKKTDGVFYVTDGVATDRYTITTMAGKIKSRPYNATIVAELDQRFNSNGPVTYFVRRD